MTPEHAPSHSLEAIGFPTETEIYILPDGQVVIADLPTELAAALGVLLQPVAPHLPALPDRGPADAAPVLHHDTD